ncbi:O-antigen ligase family protein [Clostridium tyrobutyricum]|uniref:O-antigen ligase family protein n=1 Tax=Clostridium tyrobutyricum TaxID=1519 RepID=UPI001C394362|nr:O-antigen ligase family protein [Clostridium tyrobutyricum]
MTNIIRKCFYLLGVFSTFNAVMINIGNNQLAILNFILLLLIIIQAYYKKLHLIFYQYKYPMLMILFIFLISSLGSFYFIDREWANESIVGPIKYIILLFPIFILYNDRELIYYKKYFLKGLYVSTIIQLIWEILQIILWKKYSFSLNNYIFQDLLHISVNHAWTFLDGQIFRPSGISWEPANLAVALVIGFILSKNFIIKLFFSIGILISTSRTGIIIWIVCIIIYLFIYLKKKIFIKLKHIFPILIVFILIIIVFNLNHQYILQYLTESLSRFITSDKSSNSTNSALTHFGYYKFSFDIFTKENIFQILFGYGTSIAGYPYSKYYQMYTWLGPWTPESDFITILFGNGIIGFLLYYTFIIKNIFYNRKNINEFLILISIILAGILYVYIRNTWCLLVCMILFIKPKHKVV